MRILNTLGLGIVSEYKTQTGIYLRDYLLYKAGL